MVLPARRSLALIAAACLLALVLLGVAAMAMEQSLLRSFVASPDICQWGAAQMEAECQRSRSGGFQQRMRSRI
jgi:hypothetical protein